MHTHVRIPIERSENWILDIDMPQKSDLNVKGIGARIWWCRHYKLKSPIPVISYIAPKFSI